MANLELMNRLRPKCEALFDKIEGGSVPKASEYDPSRIPENASIIRKLSQAENACHRADLKGRGKGYVIPALILEKGKYGIEANRTICYHSGNRLSHYFEKSTELVMTTNCGAAQLVKNFTRNFLNVFYPDDQKNDWSFLIDAVIVMDDDGNFWWNTGDGIFRNMLNGCEHANPGKLLKEGTVYGAHPDNSDNIEVMTAGQSKRLLMPFVANSFAKEHQALMYLLTGGASVALMSDEEVSPKAMAQANNRLAQPEAPATAMGQIECMGYYFGKFSCVRKDTSGKPVLDENGKEILDEYRDGSGFVNSAWWAKILTMKYHYKKVFLAESVLGMKVQDRPKMNKEESEVSSPDYISEFIYRRNWEVISFIRSEMTDEEVANFIDAHNKKGPLYGKLVVICETAEQKERIDAGEYQVIEALCDRNGNKAPTDPKMRTFLSLLSNSHRCKNIKHGARMTGQMLQTAFVADRKRAHRLAVHQFRKMVQDKMEVLDKDSIHEPSISELVDEGTNMSQLMVQMCPALATTWYFPLLKSVTGNTLEGLCRDADNLNITTEGLYCKISPDFAMDFDRPKLGINEQGEMEALCPGAEKGGYVRGVAVKYPKCHFREWGKIRIVPVEEYVERIKSDPMLLEYEKNLLIEKARHLSEGCIVLPAIELVKNMLAGLDFDGDALILYLNKELCELVWENEKVAPLSVCIQPKGTLTADKEAEIYGKTMTVRKAAS